MLEKIKKFFLNKKDNKNKKKCKVCNCTDVSHEH